MFERNLKIKYDSTIEEFRKTYKYAGGNGGGHSDICHIHTYIRIRTSRWLLRDERLPLTSHRVHEGDVDRVWDVFVAAANAGELDELAAAGELSRDPESGL